MIDSLATPEHPSTDTGRSRCWVEGASRSHGRALTLR